MLAKRAPGYTGLGFPDPRRLGILKELLKVSVAGDDQAVPLEDRPHARALHAARAGALRPQLRERDAADIIHTLMSPEVYRLLTCDRGWPPKSTSNG